MKVYIENILQDVEVIAGYVCGIRVVPIENDSPKDGINFVRQKTSNILIGQHTCDI